MIFEWDDKWKIVKMVVIIKIINNHNWHFSTKNEFIEFKKFWKSNVTF